MQNTKIILLLQALNAYELNRLDTWLKSPYFNTNEKLIALLGVLRQFLKLGEPFSKEMVWDSLFNTPFQPMLLTRLCSDLNLQIEKYLVHKKLEEESFTQQIYLLEAYHQRNLVQLFDPKVAQIRQQQTNIPLKDPQYHLQNYLLEAVAAEQHDKDVRKQGGNIIEDSVRELDIFYLSEKLRHYCALLNRQFVLKTEFHYEGMEDILNWVRNSAYLDEPLIAVYYHIMLMLSDGDNEAHYEIVLQLLEKYSHYFTANDLRKAYIHPQNYCIRKINAGKEPFYRRLFELFKLLLAREILLDKGVLMEWDYKNIITLGLLLEEFQQTEEFILNYSPILAPEIRQNALNYNLARLHFTQRKYPEVIKILQTVVYEEVFYALDSRWLLIKTYYELKETYALESLLDSFRIFLLRNKKIAPNTQKQYLLLLRFVRKLLKINNAKEAQALLYKVKNAPAIADKKWLLQKLEKW
jgi:hypothetical protein